MEELGVIVQYVEQLLTYGQEDSDFCVKVFSVLIKGEPKVMEPFYCDGIDWFAIENLAVADLASYSREDFKKLGWIKD
jgi:hypothetical protein